jgi:hypothetical protein
MARVCVNESENGQSLLLLWSAFVVSLRKRLVLVGSLSRCLPPLNASSSFYCSIESLAIPTNQKSLLIGNVHNKEQIIHDRIYSATKSGMATGCSS